MRAGMSLQVEASARGRSLVQGSPAECECVIDHMKQPSTPTMVRQKGIGLRKTEEISVWCEVVKPVT